MRLASIVPAPRWVAAALLLTPPALVLVGWPMGPARAAEPVAFVLPDDDGYGIADCFQPGSACGQGMADGWCEAHGHLKAVSFGPSDLTSSLKAAGVTIRCGD